MKNFIFLLVAILLQGCVHSQTSSFTDPDMKSNLPINSMTIIIDTNDINISQSLENNFIDKMKDINIKIYKGSNLNPITKTITDEQLIERMKEKNIEAYLIITGKEFDNSYYVPEKVTGFSVQSTANTSGYGSSFSHNKFNYNSNTNTRSNIKTNTTGGYYKTQLNGKYEVTLYDVYSQNKIWISQININSEYDFDGIYRQLIKDISKMLKEDGIVKITSSS